MVVFGIYRLDVDTDRQTSSGKPDKRSLRFNPDIVLRKFGTNDSKEINWRGREEFKRQYKKLVNSYRNLPEHPVVYLLTSAAPNYTGEMHTGDYQFGIRGAEIEEICQVIDQLCKEYKMPMIDIYKLTKDRREWFGKDGGYILMQKARKE